MISTGIVIFLKFILSHCRLNNVLYKMPECKSDKLSLLSVNRYFVSNLHEEGESVVFCGDDAGLSGKSGIVEKRKAS